MPAALFTALILAGFAAGAILIVRRGAARRSASRARPVAVPAVPAPASTQSSAAAASPAGALSSTEVFSKLQELAFGIAPLGVPRGEELADIAARAGTLLDSVATQPRYAPRRPLLLPQLLRAVNDDEVSRRELAGIIARDPALTGSLLKLANSSFYRVSERPVESVDRAVALLGTEGIRSLVAAAVTQPVFRLSSLQFPRFPEICWEHTYRCATAAEAHAAIVEDTDPFAAQLLGLTLGLGSIVVFRIVIDQYAMPAGRSADAAVVAAMLDSHAAAVARKIAASWDLSGRILGALEDQIPRAEMHEPTSLGRSLRFGGLIGALAVLNANQLVTDETAKASMLASGAAQSHFERIWTRLTGKGVAIPVRRSSPELRRR
ncbi:MAG TPA: HDOD domain-containing protein [Steroidobacteraceae bacterium]|nr:HDOD domain-containing protein [Steroidobacteraceae bacterium]